VPADTCCSESQRPKAQSNNYEPGFRTMREPGLFFCSDGNPRLSKTRFIAD
jgi:hypothetical protein